MAQSIRDLRVLTNCEQCKDNCSQPYDWVYVTEAEISRLAAASGKEESEFVLKRDNVVTGGVFKALELPCAFLDRSSGKCTVHSVRPLVCRLFPFYPDPVTGNAMFYPAQCGANLVLLASDANAGWNLAQYESDIEKWVRDIWREALGRRAVTEEP
jgi:Fe-S-cluster containining protein